VRAIAQREGRQIQVVIEEALSDLIEEASALWESLSQTHPFIDGNKRTAFAVTYTCLMINRAVLTATAAETEAFAISLDATGRFDFEHLNGWLRANVHLGNGET
jgi:death-on-curing protein